MSDVTQLLTAIDSGDPKAADELLPLVYEKPPQPSGGETHQGAAGIDLAGDGTGA